MRTASLAWKAKDRLVDVVAEAGKLGDLLPAIRFTMNNYTKKIDDRALVCDTKVVEFDNFFVEWFVPKNAIPGQRALYIHGGGWISGSIDEYRHILDQVATITRRATLAVNYRLAPENAFPAGLDDVSAAYDYILTNGPDGEGAATNTVIIGDSAGGNLTATAVVRAITEGRQVPDAIALLSPVLDVRASAVPTLAVDDPICSAEGLIAMGHLYTQGKTSLDDPLVSPAAASKEVLSRFPPTLLQAGSDEYLRDEGVAFAASLWNLGVPVHLSVWPNLPHAWPLLLEELPAGKRAIEEIATFLEDTFPAGATTKETSAAAA